ncbi:MAG: vWA domain-containing protein [Calditrichia bacterium]
MRLLRSSQYFRADDKKEYNLNFLNPAILYGLIAAGIPLVIHLLNRRKIKNIPFSTIQFLKRLEKKQMRNLRIRQLLLLFMRMAIILCLVLAFSRPTLQEDSVGGILAERSAIEAVIILDNSQSLNEVRLQGSLLDQLRQSFSSLQNVFQPGDRITVIQATSPQDVLISQESFSSETWDRLLGRLQPNFARSNLSAAFTTAAQQLNGSVYASREIYVLSDFQHSGMGEQFDESVAVFGEGDLADVRIFALPLQHENPENLSVDSIEVINRLLEVNQPLTIRAVLRNHHPEKHQTSLSSIVLADKRVAQQNVSIPPGQSREVRYSFTLTQTGFIEGMLTLESDALHEDNRRYFNFFVPKKIRILHLHEGALSKSFVPLIIQPAIDRGVFAYTSASAAGWSSRNFTDFDVIFIEGLNQIPSTLTQRLRQFAETGGGVVISPGTQSVAPQYREMLQTLQLGTFLERTGEPGKNEQFLSISTVDWQHPIFEGLFEKERPLLNPIEIYAAYGTKPAAGANRLISLTDKSPLLLQSAGSNGVVFYLSTPLQRDWSQLPVKGFIVPLLYRLIYFSGTGNKVDRQTLRTGEVFRQDFANLQAPFNFRVVGDEGVEAKLTPRFQGARVFLEFVNTAVPGNYDIFHNTDKIHTFSVNAWPEESLARYYAANEVGGLINNVTVLQPEGLVESVRNSRFGKELWRHFLIAAFILLLLEMLIARTGSKREYESMVAAEGGSSA